MAEYIEREALLALFNKKISQGANEYYHYLGNGGDVDYATQAELDTLNYSCELIEQFPAADVVEVRHGEWDWYPNRMDRQELLCTNCEEPAPYNEDGERTRTSYCPNCGAKMDGKEVEKE